MGTCWREGRKGPPPPSGHLCCESAHVSRSRRPRPVSAWGHCDSKGHRPVPGGGARTEDVPPGACRCAVAFQCPAHLLERAACPGDGRSASASQGSPGTARPSRAQPTAGAGGRRRARPLPRGTRRSEGGLVPRGQTGSLPDLPASASGGGRVRGPPSGRRFCGARLRVSSGLGRVCLANSGCVSRCECCGPSAGTCGTSRGRRVPCVLFFYLPRSTLLS